MYASQSLATPRDIARILFRQWRKIVLFFCSVVALTLLAIAFFPRSYASEAKLLLRIGRETVGLDPTATTGDTIMLQKTQDDEVTSAIGVLTSRKVLERVVESVGAERILKDAPSSGTSTAAPKEESTGLNLSGRIAGVLQSIGLVDPGTEMDRAIRRLESKSTVSAPKQSKMITARYTAASPELAHDVVQAMTDVFLAEHSRLNQTDGSLAFFEEQVDKLHENLTKAQEELRDRKNTYQLTTSENRQSMLEKSQEAMRQKVYDLELQENELRSRYTDEYPPLREIQRQREQAQKLLVAIPKDGTAAQDAGAAPSARASLDQELQTLNDQEYELAQLARDVRLLEGKYEMHVQKLEEARVNDELGREQITNVKVAQPATLVHKPVSPKKTIVLGLGLLVALFGSLGLAFLVEHFDQTLRTTDQVEAQLGLPVLASFPYRKRRGKEATVAASQTAAAAKVNGAASTNGAGKDRGYRGLVTALRTNGENGLRHAKTVGVIGCESSKARSRVAADLAIQAAATGAEPVLLIDADARRRRVARRFQLDASPGWRELLSGKAAVESCIKKPGAENLAVMGPGESNGHATNGTVEIVKTRIGNIKSDYGLVVIDLPAARELDGSSAAPDWIDEMVLVVDAERTRIQTAQRAKDMLNRAGVRVTGVVLANRREHIPRWLYQRL